MAAVYIQLCVTIYVLCPNLCPNLSPGQTCIHPPKQPDVNVNVNNALHVLGQVALTRSETVSLHRFTELVHAQPCCCMCQACGLAMEESHEVCFATNDMLVLWTCLSSKLLCLGGWY